MNDLLEIVARSNGTTLPSLGNILFVTATGSTTQSRADGLGRIDKPFELQRAFDVAFQYDVIIIYGTTAYTTYSVNVNRLFIFAYTSLIIDFNNTSYHQIYLYNSEATHTSIQNLKQGKLNVYFDANIDLNNCIGLDLTCEQRCTIRIDSSLSDCTFKSNIKSVILISGYGTRNFSNLNIDNFEISSFSGDTPAIFKNCTFNRTSFYVSFSYYASAITNCFFYDSKIKFRYYYPSPALNFSNNKFVRCLMDFSEIYYYYKSTLDGFSTTNKFIDCVLYNQLPGSTRVINSTWILKNCTIHNPNKLSTFYNLGFFKVFFPFNLYLIDCKYEVPVSTPYAISNNYTGQLQLINCQLPTAITGGKLPTVSSNVFIGTIPNINDVLNNI